MSEISGITGVSDSDALASTGTVTYGGSELTKETFLNLLTTQMQNQDPLDPMANEEFVAQLATFSQLEQLMTQNSLLETMYMGIASLNNASMASLVGTEVVAVGDGIAYDGDGEVELHYDADASADSASVTVYDDDGNVVYSEELGAIEEGEGSWTWDGTDQDGNQLEEGDYTWSITAENAEGDTVAVTELVIGTIDEMDYSSGSPQPSIGGVTVDIGAILRLTTADASSDTSDDTSDSDSESTDEVSDTDAAA